VVSSCGALYGLLILRTLPGNPYTLRTFSRHRYRWLAPSSHTDTSPSLGRGLSSTWCQVVGHKHLIKRIRPAALEQRSVPHVRRYACQHTCRARRRCRKSKSGSQPEGSARRPRWLCDNGRGFVVRDAACEPMCPTLLYAPGPSVPGAIVQSASSSRPNHI